ncbi:MAG TPA: PQQ-binding-like beta-propeller repeat protein, partial [Pirellulaceae bacterium]|nr:PQQ-binding-like beta-propeller repeat protein [Pirellulaceae bacterium]
MIRRFLFCLSLLGLHSLVSVAGAAEASKFGNWPQWRGPNRDEKSTETGLLKDWTNQPPKLLWQSEGFGAGFASIAVVGDVIYTTGQKDDGQYVIAAKAEDGKVLWSTKLSDEKPGNGGYPGGRSTPTIDGDRAYVITCDGTIACLNKADGTVVWSKSFKKDWNGKMMSGWGYSESPLVDGDAVVCTPGGKDAMMVKLNKATGEELWRSAVPNLGSSGKEGAGYSSIVITNAAGTKQYVQLMGQGVIGVRASDGKYLWGYNRVANGVANIPTPICVDDFVFCSSGYRDGGTALLKLSSDGDGVKAEEQYYLEANKLQNHHGGMILLGDYIYFGHGHNNGFPVCVEWKTGNKVWGGKERGPGSGTAGVTYADGNFVFRYENGIVALIEATTEGYHLKGSFKPEYQEKQSWAHPVIAGGRLYLREQDKLM